MCIADALVAVVDSDTVSHYEPLSCDSHNHPHNHRRRVQGHHHVVAKVKKANKALHSMVNRLTAELNHEGHSRSTDLMRTLKVSWKFTNAKLLILSSNY